MPRSLNITTLSIMKRLEFLFSIVLLCLASIDSSLAQCPTLPYCTFDYSIGNDGFTVHFDGEVGCGNNLTISWNFGDGGVLTGNADPVHVYPEDGVYVVKMTVSLPAPNASCTYTHEETITIAGGSPTSLWLDFEGPSLVADCQQVVFSANTVGGVPPYTYTWSMGDDYCSPNCALGNCSDPSEFTTSNPDVHASYHTLQNSSIDNVCVTVTDAMGSTDYDCIQVKVKPFVHLPEIKVVAEKSCGGDYYGLGTQILFTPDIDPISAFEYPTDYYWDFGDGNTYVDNFDGGGYAIHHYTYNSNITYPKKYTVKLTITDPYGSMQATKDIWVCNPNGPGGGGGNNDCKLVIESNPDAKTVTMDYVYGPGTQSSSEVFSLANEPHLCFPLPVKYKWTLKMTDCGMNTILNQVTTVCGLNTGPGFLLDLPSACWQQLTNDKKPWGCVSLQVNRVDNNNNNCADGCLYAYNPCIAYVLPDELDVSEIEVSGSCRTFDLTAHITGGGWKLNQTYPYKDYLWKAYDVKNPDQEIDILQDINQGVKDKKRVNVDHPYFDSFGPDQQLEFIVQLTVTDYANNTVESKRLISLNPFRLHLKPGYTRCPGVTSQFSDKPLATGGSDGPYTFTWSPASLSGENPSFTAPQSGQATYSVTVTDGPGCSLSKTTTVSVSPLAFSLVPVVGTCSSGTGQSIGPNSSNLGGSGSYTYQWSPVTYLSNPNIRNPFVQNMPAGQSQVYTLTVTDQFGGCTLSRSTTVFSYVNNLFVNIPNDNTVCYGTAVTLTADGLVDPKTTFSWTTNNPHVPLPLPNSPTLPLSELINSYPGTYNYKVRLKNNATGCYVEDDINFTVKDNWTHKGYQSIVKTAIAGTSVSVWQPYSDNRILSGVDVTSSLANVSTTWAPLPVTDIENNSGNIHALIPKNAKFIPTVQNPFTVMKVTDNKPGGCTKEFKSIRYIIIDAKPDMWISADKPSICVNGKMCFDIVFDLHLSNYETSLLPQSVKVHYKFGPPSPNTGGQSPKEGDIELKLVNHLGLYKATLCESNYFQEPTLGHPYQPYKLEVNLVNSSITFDLYDIDYSGSPIWIKVFEPANKPALTTCIPSGYFSSIDLGQNLCTLYTGYQRQLVSGSYIELHPEGGVDIYAVDPGTGHHLYINDCIDPQAMPPGEDRNAIESGFDEATQGIMLDVYPNPFTGKVNIRYAVEGDKRVNATLNLLDFTGRLVEVIRKENESAPGYYEIEHDGGSLPPGVYLYQLIIEDKGQITKKAVKIGF